MYCRKDALAKLIFSKPGFEGCSWKSRKMSSEIFQGEVCKHTTEYFVGFQWACFALIKSTHFFASFMGLGAIISEEWDNTESYTFFKVRNIVAMTTSRRFKCVPTFRGSLSIHIFMLLFRLIADLSVFTSDAARECKTTIEIGRPFEEMCDNFPLFIIQERTIDVILIISLHIL